MMANNLHTIIQYVKSMQVQLLQHSAYSTTPNFDQQRLIFTAVYKTKTTALEICIASLDLNLSLNSSADFSPQVIR